MDKYDPKPLYTQIEEYIRNRLDIGEWAINQAIPSENELSKTFGISRMTVRNAITRLVYDGLLYRIPGKGTFVNEPKVVASTTYTGYHNIMEYFGKNLKTKIINFNIGIIDTDIVAKFDLPVHYKFYIIEKIIYKEKTPLCLHTTYIPEHLAYGMQEQDIFYKQLHEVLSSKFRLSYTKVIQTLETVMVNEQEASLLKVQNNATLILMNDFFFMGDIPFELSKYLYRGDKIQLKFEYI